MIVWAIALKRQQLETLNFKVIKGIHEDTTLKVELPMLALEHQEIKKSEVK
jgi:hypothetical protein